MNYNKAQQRLICATADLILEEGVEALTHQKIAQRAQTNKASINYYFRSQNQLVRKGLLSATDLLIKIMEAAIQKNYHYDQDYVGAVINALAENSSPYNNLVVSIFLLNSLPEDTTAPARRNFQSFCSKLSKMMLRQYPEQSVPRAQIRFKLCMLPIYLNIDGHINVDENIRKQLFPEINA